jgi:hypothetical protein
VASFTFSSDDSDGRGDAAASTSLIAAHPAFPAIVAMWFAVLLGLGTLVIPAVLLERLVQASGLAAVIPAASPPLGATARTLCAGAAAAAGVLLGLALARGVAGSNRAPADAVPRPLAILHEIGEPVIEPLDEFPEQQPVPEEAYMEAKIAPIPAARPADPPESLGLEQLVERLGTAIENRRALLREAAHRVSLDPLQGFSSLEPAPRQEAAQAAAAYFARPIDLPAHRPVSEVGTEQAPMDAFEIREDDGDDDAGAGYGSLLSLGNPLANRAEYGSDDDSAMEAPEEEPSADTDAALRAALERLQRLSGVA